MQEIQRGKIVSGRFGPAQQLNAAVFFEQQLGASQLAVVVISHGIAVGAGIVDAEVVAHFDFGQQAIDGEFVVVFAQPARNVVEMIGRRVFLAQNCDMVIRAIHGRPHEIHGAGIQPDIVFVDFLFVHGLGDEAAVGARHKAAKLGHQRDVAHAGGNEHLLIDLAHAFADFENIVGLLFREVGDADAAGEIDKADMHAQNA